MDLKLLWHRAGERMTKVYSFTKPIPLAALEAFCALEIGFTDQFVYYRKDTPTHLFGLGRCIAFSSLKAMEYELEGVQTHAPYLFSFERFDKENPSAADEITRVFPVLDFLLPEIVIIEDANGVFLQVNSLGPINKERVEKFEQRACAGEPFYRKTIPYKLTDESREVWRQMVQGGFDAIEAGRVQKVVLSRRTQLISDQSFSSTDLLFNLIKGSSQGTVVLYRYADVFFCACTPELLVRKCASTVESMCLAGTCRSATEKLERARLAASLLADSKNRAEHEYVVHFIKEVFGRICYDLSLASEPYVISLPHIQHLCTPLRAYLPTGFDITNLRENLHPTPAVAGYPVGEARMLIRQLEPYNRGFFAGTCGYVDGFGDGEFSVSLRCGVFDGHTGWLYAGCGIVSGSVADDEYDETALKLTTILSAFEGKSGKE